MDLPVLNTLEKIYPNQDTGAEAIRKLVKNQNLIEEGIKEAQLIQGPTGATGPVGPKGDTPYIGENGNWFISGVDTGISASGAQDLTEIKQKINILSSCEYISALSGASLVDYIKALPAGTHKVIQFQGATDTPTVNWYYADIYTHINTSSYFYVRLYRLDSSEADYTGRCTNGTFEGWAHNGYTEILDVPFNSGFIDDSTGASHIKITGNEVELHVDAKKSDGTAFEANSSTSILTIPSSVLPPKNYRIIVPGYPYGSYATVLINKNGTVTIRSVSSSSITSIYFTISYRI